MLSLQALKYNGWFVLPPPGDSPLTPSFPGSLKPKPVCPDLLRHHADFHSHTLNEPEPHPPALWNSASLLSAMTNAQEPLWSARGASARSRCHYPRLKLGKWICWTHMRLKQLKSPFGPLWLGDDSALIWLIETRSVSSEILRQIIWDVDGPLLIRKWTLSGRTGGHRRENEAADQVLFVSAGW